MSKSDFAVKTFEPLHEREARQIPFVEVPVGSYFSSDKPCGAPGETFWKKQDKEDSLEVSITGEVLDDQHYLTEYDALVWWLKGTA